MDLKYTNVHRMFLQACARHSVLSPKQTQDILESVQNKCELFSLLIFHFFPLFLRKCSALDKQVLLE